VRGKTGGVGGDQQVETPERELLKDWSECKAGRCQLVHGRRAWARVSASRDQARVDQAAQSVREKAGAGAAHERVEIRVSQRPGEKAVDDEKRPAVADDVKRERERAEPVVRSTGGRHGSASPEPSGEKTARGAASG